MQTYKSTNALGANQVAVGNGNGGFFGTPDLLLDEEGGLVVGSSIVVPEAVAPGQAAQIGQLGRADSTIRALTVTINNVGAVVPSTFAVDFCENGGLVNLSCALSWDILPGAGAGGDLRVQWPSAYPAFRKVLLCSKLLTLVETYSYCFVRTDGTVEFYVKYLGTPVVGQNTVWITGAYNK